MNPTGQVRSELWWAVPQVLAGSRGPYLDPRRITAGGGPLAAYPDELPVWWADGIRAVVCMVEAPQAAGFYQTAGFAYHFMPVPDGAAPKVDQFQKFLGFVMRHRAMKMPVAVHCEAGMGRTGTAIAGYLIMTEKLTPEEAVERVRLVRPGAVESLEQMKFLQELYVANRH